MFGLFGEKKPYNAQVNSTNVTLEVEAGDNLLNAALKSGLAWPHNCRVGSCGTCRCKLLEGKIKALNDFGYVLDADELDEGMILACQTRLRTDISVEVSLDDDAQPLVQAETAKGTISSIQALTHDIIEVRVKLAQAFPEYIAGQYAEIAIDGIEDPRSYSFARAPSLEDTSTVSFYVRRVPNGAMSNLLHDGNRLNNEVTVSGPHGTFYLRESKLPALCIAGGSGLAPIKAILEQLAHDGFDRQVVFLFGARTEADLYCIEQMEKLSEASAQFNFIPILSHLPDDSDWTGERGMVTEFITKQGLDLAASQAYLCGPPGMIDAAIEVLNKQGMNDDHIFFDKFLDASHLPGGKR
ncbi:MAG: 2Fe-2S iron-sulfur cluster binding domain-containing protein [Acidiferrobacterales bacterium]|nr:2Fe-2S iron-sulfur cluster binding domain-containing protein [Acidiferrobacterales bacterium]